MSFKDISYLAAPLFSKAEPFVKVIFFLKFGLVVQEEMLF